MPRGKTVGLTERGEERPAGPARFQHRGQRRPLVDVTQHAPLPLNFAAKTIKEKRMKS